MALPFTILDRVKVIGNQKTTKVRIYNTLLKRNLGPVSLIEPNLVHSLKTYKVFVECKSVHIKSDG